MAAIYYLQHRRLLSCRQPSCSSLDDLNSPNGCSQHLRKQWQVLLQSDWCAGNSSLLIKLRAWKIKPCQRLHKSTSIRGNLTVFDGSPPPPGAVSAFWLNKQHDKWLSLQNQQPLMPENWTYFGEQFFFLCQNKENSSRQHLKLLARRESFNRGSLSVTRIKDEEDFQVLESNSFYITDFPPLMCLLTRRQRLGVDLRIPNNISAAK